MLRQRNGLSLQSPLRPLSVLVFHLLLTHSCRGESQLISASQPIVATAGDDIILPCHLEPAVDVAAMTLEWTRSDLDPEFVFVWRFGLDLIHTKHPSYKGRTSLFSDELKRGNISLKLSDVRPSDAGRYRCFIPYMRKGSFIELVVGAASSPVISLAGIDRDKGGVVLQCESAGWHPEPEVLWLDGEGKLLSAGPTETVRGPDDLYTVSSRVTVEKRHSNSFTCRVQQRNINQTTETLISMSDDFFKVQSSSAVPVTGLAVCIVMFIVLLLIFLWQMTIKTKRRLCDEPETGKKKNSSNTNKTEDQSVPVEEREHLMTTDMKIKTQRCQQQLLEEQQRREEAEKEVQTLKDELETKKKELETKQCELQQLHEEKQRNEDELQTLKEELEKKNKEKRKEAEKEVETLTKQLETKQMEVDTKIKKIDQLMADVKNLTEEKQRIEKERQQLQKEMQELFQRKEQEAKEAERLMKELADKNIEWQKKLSDERTRREAAERQVEALKKELKTKPKTNESVPVQLRASPPTGPVIVHDTYGKYIRLKNRSNMEQQLKNWEIHVQFNNSKPIKYKFDHPLRLKSGETVTIWSPGYRQHYTSTPSNLEWRELKTWSSTDQLQIKLISSTGQTQRYIITSET